MIKLQPTDVYTAIVTKEEDPDCFLELVAVNATKDKHRSSKKSASVHFQGNYTDLNTQNSVVNQSNYGGY